MQYLKPALDESKAISAGSVVTFNVACSEVINNLFIRFVNSGADAAISDITAGVDRILLQLKGVDILDCSAQQLVDLYNYLGTKRTGGLVLGATLPLNLGAQIYDWQGMENEFAWRCGKSSETNPSKKIESINVQIFTNSSMANITDVELYSVRTPVEEDYNGSYIQFNRNPQSYKGTGQSQINTLPKDTNDIMLMAVAYNGGGTITHGETIYNNDNISRNVSASANTLLNSMSGFGKIDNAYVHNYCTGAANSGLLIESSGYQYSVRTTFSKAPTDGYDICLLKIHNPPAKVIQAVSSNLLMCLDNMGR